LYDHFIPSCSRAISSDVSTARRDAPQIILPLDAGRQGRV